MTKSKACFFTAVAAAALLFNAAPAMADVFLESPAPQKPLPELTPLDAVQGEAEPAPVLVEETVTLEVEEVVAVAPQMEEETAPEPRGEASYLVMTGGIYDPFTHGKKAAAGNLEFQPAYNIFGVIKPIAGVMATTEESVYGYGGLGVPFNVGDNVKIMPSVAYGAYKQGKGVDLDRKGIFRFGGEVAYQFDNASRLGMNAHVLTNGKSARAQDRTEVVGVFYALPLWPTVLSPR